MSDPLPSSRPTLDDRPRRRWVQPVLVLVILLVVALVAWYAWQRSHEPAAAAPGATPSGAPGAGGSGKGKGGGRPGRVGFDPNRAQPVTAAGARVGDINIMQTALGTVTALKTVTVKPRVDGLLQSVAFSEGQLVKAGDLLAQIDPAPFQVALAQAEGQLARDAAQLNNARLDLERYRTLLAQDSIASQQVDQQAALVKQLEGTVKMDEANADNAKLQLSYTRIIAPIPGRLGLRVVDAGNMVRQSDANGIAVITQVDPITAVFPIPQDALPPVIARLRAHEKMPVEAWDREQKNLLGRGTLLGADNQIDVTTGTVKLKAQFANAEGKLFPNQFVNIRMVVDTKRGVVVVPSAAVQRNAQGTLVYVVRDDSTVAMRPVQAGPTEGLDTAIDSGLKAGERVVTDGVDRIREGAKVEVVDPNAAAPAAGARGPRGEGQAGDGKAGDGKRGDWKKRREAKGGGDKGAP